MKEYGFSFEVNQILSDKDMEISRLKSEQYGLEEEIMIRDKELSAAKEEIERLKSESRKRTVEHDNHRKRMRNAFDNCMKDRSKLQDEIDRLKSALIAKGDIHYIEEIERLQKELRNGSEEK